MTANTSEEQSIKAKYIIDQSNQYITNFPMEHFFDYPYLVELNLSNNQLWSLPLSISQCILLERVDISENPMSRPPAVLFSLPKLRANPQNIIFGKNQVCTNELAHSIMEETYSLTQLRLSFLDFDSSPRIVSVAPNVTTMSLLMMIHPEVNSLKDYFVLTRAYKDYVLRIVPENVPISLYFLPNATWSFELKYLPPVILPPVLPLVKRFVYQQADIFKDDVVLQETVKDIIDFHETGKDKLYQLLANLEKVPRLSARHFTAELVVEEAEEEAETELANDKDEKSVSQKSRVSQNSRASGRTGKTNGKEEVSEVSARSAASSKSGVSASPRTGKSAAGKEASEILENSTKKSFFGRRNKKNETIEEKSNASAQKVNNSTEKVGQKEVSIESIKREKETSIVATEELVEDLNKGPKLLTITANAEQLSVIYSPSSYYIFNPCSISFKFVKDQSREYCLLMCGNRALHITDESVPNLMTLFSIALPEMPVIERKKQKRDFTCFASKQIECYLKGKDERFRMHERLYTDVDKTLKDLRDFKGRYVIFNKAPKESPKKHRRSRPSTPKRY
ncbi:hypothetical protein TRFO_30415 [Tritrichomonas foetus]|uniref:Leucine Rich Repeat family protein n=1 Tax=Tritrichomonas foetus TaxID=1144522 RepID=A0A1J4JYX6_9EUKA|nr:hypothetical protein TRFO_30415 [Tritrichomonas foetus]|eukprot:OHT02469.1 hypothetical protein TRFO_30415 [Tritrichomonas foetus]